MTLPSVHRFQGFWDSLNMSENPIRVFSRYLDKLGSSYYFPFGGIKQALVTTDPLLIEHVLQKNYKNYGKSEIQTKKMGQFLGDGLLTSHGSYWLTQRRIIQEGFKKDRLQSYLQGMEEIVSRNLIALGAQTNTSTNLDTFLKKVTFEMVMGSLFSERIDPKDLQTVAYTIGAVQKYILNQIVQPYLTPWTKISGEYSQHQRNRELSDQVIRSIIQNRKGQYHPQADILDILLQVKYQETGKGMTDSQILQESMQLIVAGHETSSTVLLWTIYLLTQHPEIYEKVKSELEGLSNISMESLSTLTYTLQVLQEAMRLYPPFWMIDREALADDEVGGIRIDKGTMVLVYIYGVHHSSEYWEDPDSFNPNRFHGGNPKKETPFTYLPFGAGPKGCIGGNYATLQMLVILKKLLAAYEITFTGGKNVGIAPLIMLKPKEELFFNLKERK
ncbi:MAG: cytochrome P450 [Saprospiraceae bacterium]|nr:cytochrome P450 [Saprospiraceae bacterium]